MGKTNRSLPKFRFPNFFSVTLCENYWSSTENQLIFLEETIFPFLGKVKTETGAQMNSIRY